MPPLQQSVPPQGTFGFQAVERVVFGRAAGTAVAGEAEARQARRVFVLGTASLDRLADGPLREVERGLGALHAGTFARIGSHTPDVDVIAAAAAARAAGADLLVAVGGGSVIDGAKAVQWCLARGIDTVDAMWAAAGVATPKPHEDTVTLRIVAVPTTLSAAEYMPVAGVSQTATRQKVPLRDRQLVPATIVLDPLATLHTPLELLLSTGMRAVDHAVETYCAAGANPITDAFALRGLQGLAEALRAVARDPQDVPARAAAQIATWECVTPAMAGVGVGASHGIGYALGARFGVPHGHTSCILLPATLLWNAEVNGERQRALSERLGDGLRPAGELVRELVAALGLPGRLRDAGVSRDSLDELAEAALAYEPVRSNPRPIRTSADVRAILELAW